MTIYKSNLIVRGLADAIDAKTPKTDICIDGSALFVKLRATERADECISSTDCPPSTYTVFSIKDAKQSKSKCAQPPTNQTLLNTTIQKI